MVSSIRPSDLFSLAWSSLRRNRLRSILTIGAVAIGIGVMMYLISLGYGLERLTLGQVAKSAALLSLNITSGSQELQPLNKKEIARIEALPKVKSVLPQSSFKGAVSLNQKTAPATIVSVDPDFLAIGENTKLKVGNYYRAEDKQTMVVSSGFLKVFGLDEGKNPLVIFTMSLDQKEYPGVASVNNINVSGVVDSPAVIVYFPRPYLESIVGEKLPAYESAKATVETIDSIEPVKNELIKLGYKVATVVDTVQEIKKVFSWIQFILGALGLIAIVVASIGMFNTLTISLLERTREIGIMKALGMKKKDISRLFLAESLLMGLIGGLAGIGLAVVGQQLTLFILSLLASLAQGTVPTIFLNPAFLIFGFLFFALLISLLTGIYPAMRATRLNAIDAIRYE